MSGRLEGESTRNSPRPDNPGTQPARTPDRTSTGRPGGTHHERPRTRTEGSGADSPPRESGSPRTGRPGASDAPPRTRTTGGEKGTSKTAEPTSGPPKSGTVFEGNKPKVPNPSRERGSRRSRILDRTSKAYNSHKKDLKGAGKDLAKGAGAVAGGAIEAAGALIGTARQKAADARMKENLRNKGARRGDVKNVTNCGGRPAVPLGGREPGIGRKGKEASRERRNKAVKAVNAERERAYQRKKRSMPRKIKDAIKTGAEKAGKKIGKELSKPPQRRKPEQKGPPRIPITAHNRSRARK